MADLGRGQFVELHAFCGKIALFEPGGVELLEAAVGHRNVQPLIDEILPRGVALQPVGLFREVEWRLRMHRAQHAGVKLLLVAVSEASVIIRSALPLAISSKIVTLSS